MTSPEDTEPAETSEIHAILDVSAIVSFGRGHIHVGELIMTVEESDGYVGIPATALLAAHAEVRSDDLAVARLRYLATNASIVNLDLTAETVAEIAPNVELSDGDLAAGHVLWAVSEFAAYYVTCEPNRVPPQAAHLIVAIPTEDA